MDKLIDNSGGAMHWLNFDHWSIFNQWSNFDQVIFGCSSSKRVTRKNFLRGTRSNNLEKSIRFSEKVDFEYAS